MSLPSIHIWLYCRIAHVDLETDCVSIMPVSGLKKFAIPWTATPSTICEGIDMQHLAMVQVEEVLDTFRNDQKVTVLGVPWPATMAEKIALLRTKDVGRPVDRILRLNWGRYELEKAEFLSSVRRVRDDRQWSIGEMCAAHLAGTFSLPNPNSVPQLVASMRAGFRENEFVMVEYLADVGIFLEDGHNRATAAVLAGMLPAKIMIYVGQ